MEKDTSIQIGGPLTGVGATLIAGALVTSYRAFVVVGILFLIVGLLFLVYAMIFSKSPPKVPSAAAPSKNPAIVIRNNLGKGTFTKNKHIGTLLDAGSAQELTISENEQVDETDT